MRATLDLIGLYNYNPKLLDELVLPEAIEDKRADLVDNLLLETAELEVLYTDPDFMQKAIGIWSRKQSPIWAELYDTTQYEYNPIWNKDGVITEERDLAATEDVTTNVDREDKLQDKNTRNFEDKETRDLSDVSDRDVFGFNSSTAAPAEKNTVKGTGTDTFNHSGTDTVDHTGTQDIDTTVDRDTTDTGTITRTEQGNIGVTSTQSLIQEQREVVKFNILDYIINEFRDRFCLKVY